MTLQDQEQAKAKLDYYQQKLRTETDPRRRDKFIEYVSAWRRGIELVQRGYTFSSVQIWATQTASGEYSRALEIDLAEREAIKEATAGTELKSQEEISAITGIPISQLKSREEISRMLSRPSTTGVFAYPTTPRPSAPFPTLTEESPFGEFYGVPTKAPAPSPLTISEYVPRDDYYTRDVFGMTSEAIRRTPEGIRMSLAGGITEFDIGKGFEYIFDPYKYGKRIGEERITITQPQFGTIVSEEYLPTEAKLFKGTKFEYIRMKGFEPPLELFETRISKHAPAVIETGALIAASVTPAGAAVVSGYITGRGVKQTIEAPTIPKKLLGVPMIVGGIVGMGATMRGLQRSITQMEISEAVAYKPQLKFGVRETLKGGVIKDVYVSRYQVGGTKVIKEAEIYFKPLSGEKFAMMGRGSVFARTTEFMTGKEITYMAGTELKGLGFGLGVGTKGWQPSISVGKVTKQIEFIAIKPELAKPLVEGRIRVSERFAPLKGKVKKPEWKQSGMFLYREGKDIEPILGSKVKFFKEAPEKFVVGGISKEGKDLILSLGGKVKGFKPAWKTPSGIEIESPKFKFDIEEISLLKIKQPAPSDVGFIQALGRGSSQEFLKQLYAPSTQAVAGKLIQAPSIKFQPSGAITSMVGAGAIISKVKLKEYTRQTPATTKLLSVSKEREALAQPSKMRAIVKVREIQKVVQLPKMETKLLSMPKEKLISGQVVVPAQTNISKQMLKQTIATIPSTRFPSPFAPTTPMGGFPFFFLPFTFPRLKFKEERKIIKVKRMMPVTRYRPSLVAVSLDLRTEKIPEAYRRGAGGLIIRKIISKEPKKKVVRVKRKSEFDFKMPKLNLGLIRVRKKRRKKK